MKMQSSLLIKNTMLSLIGQIVPLLLAVVAIPYIVHGLGVERFAMLKYQIPDVRLFNSGDLRFTKQF